MWTVSCDQKTDLQLHVTIATIETISSHDKIMASFFSLHFHPSAISSYDNLKRRTFFRLFFRRRKVHRLSLGLSFLCTMTDWNREKVSLAFSLAFSSFFFSFSFLFLLIESYFYKLFLTMVVANSKALILWLLQTFPLQNVISYFCSVPFLFFFFHPLTFANNLF